MKKKYLNPESEIIVIQSPAILYSSDLYNRDDDDDNNQDDSKYDCAKNRDKDYNVGAMRELFDGMLGIEH